MSRRALHVVAVALVAVLCGCSELPAEPLAMVAPAQASVTPAQDSAASEGRRVSYRLTNRVVAPVAIPVPLLPESVPIVETRIAVMPEGLDSIEVWAAPIAGSPPLTTFDRFDEFNQPRVFRILADRGDYFEVQVPMRPNGAIGYIMRDDVDVTTTDQRILIDLSDRSVIVWNGSDVVLDTTGTVGSARNPTPTGSFYVRNVFEWYADSIYGPYVIPLSAYSESIDQINGGDAVVAIHGTQRPDLVGAAASLGCVRLENGVLRELAAIVEPGAPVEIIS